MSKGDEPQRMVMESDAQRHTSIIYHEVQLNIHLVHQAFFIGQAQRYVEGSFYFNCRFLQKDGLSR